MARVGSRRARAVLAVGLIAGGIATPLPALRADEPSAAFREQTRRTIELRKQRRMRERTAPAVGLIAPYPFPPVLIIRHTPEGHAEVEGLLRQLRQ